MKQPHQPINRASQGQRGGILLFLVIVLAAAAGAWKLGLFDSLLGEKEEVVIEGAEVRRGDLRISEVVRGNLEATDSVSIKSELEGRSTIIFLAEEGSTVEKGQLLVELDSSVMEDELVRQEIEVKNAEASFTKAKEQYDIQVIQNESDLADATLALELAQLDLAKYVGTEENPGEYANEESKAKESVLLQEENLKRAVTALEWSDKLFEKGFVTESDNESKKLEKQRADIELTRANRELTLMQKFSNLRTLKELNADIQTRIRDIEKVKKQANARLADFKAERDSAEYKLERERNQKDELADQLSKVKIYAPEPGLLVYARERSRWGAGDVVKEGDEVRERQELLTIPRAGGMTVQASIHETKLKKVTAGLPCIVSVDAFPGRTFEGHVGFVAVMADSGSWRSDPNQRLYKAEITLSTPTNDMRPGMSCSVEILVEDLQDVHYVPRQCVLLDGGETIVFVAKEGKAERRTVEVGLDNSKWVSINSGLTAGEIVTLGPPADFEPAPVPEGDKQDFGPAGPTAGSAGAAPSKGGMPSGVKSSGRPTAGKGGRPGGSKGGRPSGSASAGERPASSYGKGRPSGSTDTTAKVDKGSKP